MSLKLGAADRDAVRSHAEEAYPRECCGFLLGMGKGGAKEVRRVLRARNERMEAAEGGYRISPEAYLDADREAGRSKLDIIGFYHSHPDAGPTPSPIDRDRALPWCSYVIVSVAGGEAREIRSWVLSDDDSRLEPEPMIE
jgi:proteasome lid subunit RPN8/RPN11